MSGSNMGWGELPPPSFIFEVLNHRDPIKIDPANYLIYKAGKTCFKIMRNGRDYVRSFNNEPDAIEFAEREENFENSVMNFLYRMQPTENVEA